MAAQMLHIAIRNLSSGDPAAVCARSAIDRLLRLFRNCFESPFNKVMALEPRTKAFIFFALFLAGASDLDEIGNHSIIISRKNISYRICFNRRPKVKGQT